MKEIDFSNIQKDFNKSLIDLEENLKNDKSLKFWKRNTNRVVVLNYFQLAKKHLESLMLICEYNTSLTITSPPIVRTIYEILLIIIFLFDDLDNRVFSLAKTIHRERKREIECFDKLGYPTNKKEEFNKSWEEYLQELYVDLIPDNFDWTENNERFPQPNQILNSFEKTSPKTHSFLEFMQKRHYRVFSIDSHIEPWRIAKLTRALNGTDEETILELKNEQIWFGFLFSLAIATEIEINLKYGQEKNLLNLWIIFSDLCNPAKEIYEQRYKSLLNI